MILGLEDTHGTTSPYLSNMGDFNLFNEDNDDEQDITFIMWWPPFIAFYGKLYKERSSRLYRAFM